MDPHLYCLEALDEIQDTPPDRVSRRFPDCDRAPLMLVLWSYAQVSVSAWAFVTDLELLAKHASQTGREPIAAAARAVLQDWQACLVTSANCRN